MTTLDNQYTKLQIKRWLENAVKKAQDRSPREKLRRLRIQKLKQVARNYGL